MIKQSRITEIKGIGEKTEKLFAKLGITTAGELLRYYPRGYDVYEEAVPIAQLEEGKIMTVSGVIFGRVQVSGTRNMQVTTMHVKDLTGTLKVVWFRMPFLRNTFAGGGTITLRGRVVSKKSGLVMEHPEIFYPAEKYEEKLHTLQPVYGLTAGLSNHAVSKAVRQVIDGLDLSKEHLPEEVRMKYSLAEYNYAIRGIHFPEDKEVYYHARRRLVFEEFLSFILSIRKLRDKNEKLENAYVIPENAKVNELIGKLPYTLTKAQQKVWKEIAADMASDTVMSRLVQGDVGSGKTIVAILALLNVAYHGLQGAMMAPTEVLARQHYESITRLFETYDIPVKVELLTGSMTAKEKRRAYDRIACGYAKIIVGTHALIQGAVEYDSLALVVTDEQHRFGVKQREAFAQKGGAPHVLVMSATPIPRTLAIILYGDLDISVIDELPANRLPIKNCVVDTGYRATAYTFMKKQIAEGRQCYVICPMVEESEHLEAENVMDYAKMLQEEMGKDICVSFLHGKMKQAEKDSIMEQFGRNEIQILVSTTVIEVGIDVPNATVMMIENAERFGLAQLHQLRGRVGRGKHQSYCIFMSASKAKETKERLEILNKTNDGFKIASEDLRLRGPGDLFGIRQSGLMDFKLGDVFQDAKILKEANEAADWMLKNQNKWDHELPDYETTASVII
ncbi:ATP-dependent DNA helicase RecG [Faecalicatena contorta]|uniref:ATP-dependent DNA helicase RecG n=1 Tax=Faecalicatena contorta TaxID=39482 RepID=UPI001F230161|nr:ATP-dependent DNA helicase RecG [Faecalicatena contorta]MCF2554463.1 ATP-dependent DNA helicase RecG [Faecalicatena contorta]MCF2680421.1 ATP-dependent DNA helicase RecG [Faecalicatena contorta]